MSYFKFLDDLNTDGDGFLKYISNNSATTYPVIDFPGCDIIHSLEKVLLVLYNCISRICSLYYVWGKNWLQNNSNFLPFRLQESKYDYFGWTKLTVLNILLMASHILQGADSRTMGRDAIIEFGEGFFFWNNWGLFQKYIFISTVLKV